MFYVYTLYSKFLDSYYTGSTSNVVDRLKSHLQNHKGFTSKAKDWVIVYSESFETKKDALDRERQIKNWKSKIMIQKLINS